LRYNILIFIFICKCLYCCFCFCDTGDWTQGLMHEGEVLYIHRPQTLLECMNWWMGRKGKES
jgi:hypothetical protein